MNNDNPRSGLWKKDGERGSYYSGKITVGGVEYWANLYKNDRKETDKHPDLNLVLKPVESRGSRQAPAQQRADEFEDDALPF